MGVRSWPVGVAGMMLALSACGQASAGDPASSTSNHGGAVQFAASQTCTPGAGPECQAVGDEHVVTPSEFTRVGVVTATPAADGSAAVDVVFDTQGATAFLEASRQVVEKGESGRLVLRIDDQVISAVRVPSAVAVTQMHIVLPDHLHAQDVVRQITEG